MKEEKSNSKVRGDEKNQDTFSAAGPGNEESQRQRNHSGEELRDHCPDGYDNYSPWG
jgi:hypothetical protein